MTRGEGGFVEATVQRGTAPRGGGVWQDGQATGV